MEMLTGENADETNGFGEPVKENYPLDYRGTDGKVKIFKCPPKHRKHFVEHARGESVVAMIATISADGKTVVHGTIPLVARPYSGGNHGLFGTGRATVLLRDGTSHSLGGQVRLSLDAPMLAQR